MKETELINLRGKREKHFLQENGDIIAKIYDDDVNYYNNGIYEEIDNSLIKENNYYYNKNNSYKVMFKENNSDVFMKYIFENHYINFEIKDGNKSSIIISKSDNQYTQQVAYNNVFTNIDFVYDILPTNIKENIFINDPTALNEKICFKITSDLELFLTEDNSIKVENILVLKKPFIIDSSGKKCNFVLNSLTKENDYYLLELKLDVDSILKENLTFPIVIDPTITNYGENNSVYDTYIYPGDSNDVRYDKEYLKVGVDNNGKTNRALIKFDLPTIGTGSQIIEATLELRGYPDFDNTYASDVVAIHRITEPWTESLANWSNMNDKYDSRVEAAFESDRSYYYDDGVYRFSLNGDDLTNLVKKWYSMYPNYGLMLKTFDETYHQSVIPMFFSKNNTVSGTNPKPLLIIKYRNQNGLEEYMDYKKISFRNGDAYINSYNGNLTTKFQVGKTINGRFPAELNLIYNTNDVILNNNVGLGKGYRLSFQQTIKPVVIENITYLEYTDEDGTIHYFVNNNGQYVDEDGLNLTISELDTLYVLWDKKGVTKRFEKINNIGYLIAIEDISRKAIDGHVINIEYNNDHTISCITDDNGKQIEITYTANTITIDSPEDTIYLNFNNNKISNIVRCSGTTYYNYDSNELISSIVDENGLKIGFEYYDQTPHRIKKVSEYATNNTIGNYFNVSYNYNSTTIKSNNNNVLTMTFNNNGNLESSSNLSSGEDIFNAYGRNEEYSDPVQVEGDLSYLKNKNKLLNMDLPCSYVKNYISDSSFENNSTIFTASSGANLSVVTEQANTGLKSLKAISTIANQVLTKTISITKGNNYTFSASIKNSTDVKLSLSYTDAQNNIVEEINEINTSTDFERHDVSIYYPSDAISDLFLKILLLDAGITYIDDIQLENGEVSNPYNLLDNSDFSIGLTGWTLDAIDLSGHDVPTDNIFEVVTLTTGKTALKVHMSPLYQSAFYRTFPICGKAGDTYRISFWYKNKGLKGNSGEFARTNNRVIINFNYIDTEHGHGVAPSKQFNPNENEWQYFSTSFTAEYDFNEMYVNFFQTFNANDFYITNLYVAKDYRTINYEYDEEGNVTSVNTLNNTSSQFNYDSNNELIKMIGPNGNKLIYEYEDLWPDSINTLISEEGILTKIKYYDYKSPTTTKIIHGKANFTANEIIKAKIRIKGTNGYIKLSHNDIIVTYEDCNHNYWCLSFINNDTCKIYNPVLKNRYLGFCGNSYVSPDFDTNLTLIPNDDGSYYIKKAGTNDYLGFDKQYEHLWIGELNENECKFYIEQTFNEKFLENDATYTSDGRFITAISDSMVNTTAYQYDTNNGLLLSVTNPKGIITEYTYNNKKQLISIENNNLEVQYRYNNNLLSEVEVGNKIYSFEYDNYLNRTCSKLNNNSLVSDMFETNNGNLIKTTYANNNEIIYSYDIFNRIESLATSTDTFNFKYDSNGNLSKIISNNDIYKLYYDLSKRISKTVYNDFRTLFNYNNDDYIESKKYILDDVSHNVVITYDGSLITSVDYDNDTLTYTYDNLNRLVESKTNSYTYKNKGKRTSYLVESITNLLGRLKYKYDKLNNITHIYLNDSLTNKYYYDNNNQLIKEDDYENNQTIIYTYNSAGNMTNKTIYTLGTTNIIDQVSYGYNNLNWEDQLTSINNKTITYDNLGNTLTIGNDILEWCNGKQLKKYNNINFKYNHDGIRVNKQLGNTITNYYLEGDKIILEKTGNNVIYYMYDAVDDLVGFKYNNNTYYYIKNLQNDIIAIIDDNDDIIAKYKYDSWGNILSIKDANDNDIISDTHVGMINPFRYRSYYYDKETNLYYLNSRYYSPELCRFLSIDSIISSNQDILSHNLYLYVSNNPINSFDLNGNIAFLNIIQKAVATVVKTAAQVIKTVTKSVNKLNEAKKKNLPDYTDEVNKVLVKNLAQTAVVRESLSGPSTLLVFYKEVDNRGAWDYKYLDRWEKDFDVPYTKEFIYDGQIMTPEDFGNFNYGFIGSYLEFPSWLLFLGGGYAKHGISLKLTRSYFGDAYNDHVQIQNGIDLYKKWFNK